MKTKLFFMGGALFIGLLMAQPASAARHGGHGGHGSHFHGGRGHAHTHGHLGGAHHRGVHVTRGHLPAVGARVNSSHRHHQHRYHRGHRGHHHRHHRHHHRHHNYRAYRPYNYGYRTVIADPWVAAATSSYGARYAAASRGYACGPTYYPMYSRPYYSYGCAAPVTCYTF